MSLELSSFGLVIFDCDGVLVDSERLTVDVEAEMLTELGWPMTADEVVARFMGRSLASELAEIGERLGQEAVVRFEQELVPRMTELFDSELTPVDGVPELLAALDAAGVPTCVASSGEPDGIRRKLDRTGLRAHLGSASPRRPRWSTASRRRTCSCSPPRGWEYHRRAPPWSRTASRGSRRGSPPG